MPNPRIGIILASTRQGRHGERVAKWIFGLARARADLSAELIDLIDWPLPFYAEHAPPVVLEGQYQGELARRWVQLIGSLDGYVVVTPEYNHGYPAALKNALDYVYAGWNRKPVAFVSYGGLAGGVRAVEQLRQVAVELQMAPVRFEINIPMIHSAFNESGPVDTIHEKRAKMVLDQLVWWANTLRDGRRNYPEPKKGSAPSRAPTQ